MTIAITINKSWNIYNFRKGLVKTLLSKGHDVISIAPNDKYVTYLEEWGCTHEDIPMTSTGSNPISEFTLIREYKRILKKHKVDLLLSYTIKCNIYGTLAANSLSIPSISNVSGLGTVFLKNSISALIAIRLYQRAFKKIGHVFFQNEDDREVFTRKIQIPLAKTSILPGSGINLEEWKSSPYKTQEKPLFLMVARLLIEKGVYEFARAAKKVRKKYPNTRFKLIGILEKGHSRSVKETDLNTWINDGTLTYEPQRDDIGSQMELADAVIQPSYREGMSRVLLEAGAKGRPALTSDVPGCRDIIQHEVNGLIFQPKNWEDLAQKIMDYIELSESSKLEMAQNARSTIEDKFDENLVIGRYLNIIGSLVRLD